MKKYLVILTVIIIIIALSIGIYFILNKTSVEVPADEPVKAKVTTALTPELITKLQSYSYYQQQPRQGFKQIFEQDPELAKWISDTLVSNIITFEEHEKFFTSDKLTYVTWDDHFAVRGILQVREKDGSITEQDVEYRYRFGEWNEDNTKVRLKFEGKSKLGEQRVFRGDES